MSDLEERVDVPFDIIKYHSRVFEVPSSRLSEMLQRPERIQEYSRRAGAKGIERITPTGEFACIYCYNYENNVHKLIERYGEGAQIEHFVEGQTGLYVRGCNYKGGKVVWVTEFGDNRKSEVVMAQMTPCAMYDAMIEDLVENGLLDPYEVAGNHFDYPAIRDLMPIPRSAPTGYSPRPAEGFFGKLMSALRMVF